MSKILEVNDTNFKEQVLEADKPVLVEFWAPWCGPCKMVAPVLEELAEEMDGKIKICKVNVDENTDTASDYGVMSIPTMVLIKDGEVQEQVVGYLPREELQNKIEENI
ncbi:thioredoxin [Natranaerobius thermophilus]|uniref:Thioredoxin n=1 Tax=Natranaerobius thermophilus (strain ATCC BAA-1301 / DSM 18059 / JW/NM-WN-LF) TaxID=457570 RepID=B2A481_NATTJ|nr:thioredoxin [Natranaerobius thermophilus]ACB83735.1 thioredoxin [Natranaerobius thermophilus JW/NM-WN-LF]